MIVHDDGILGSTGKVIDARTSSKIPNNGSNEKVDGDSYDGDGGPVERPTEFKCLKCNAFFTNHSNLARHERIHTGEKPFKCEICHREFSHSSNLTTHRRTHTGERPYRCRVPGCTKRFARSDHRASHERTHDRKKARQIQSSGAGKAPRKSRKKEKQCESTPAQINDVTSRIQANSISGIENPQYAALVRCEVDQLLRECRTRTYNLAPYAHQSYASPKVRYIVQVYNPAIPATTANGRASLWQQLVYVGTTHY